jgi:hypothetical protein
LRIAVVLRAQPPSGPLSAADLLRLLQRLLGQPELSGRKQGGGLPRQLRPFGIPLPRSLMEI